MKKASKLSGVIVLVGIALATAFLATWLSGIVEEDGSPVHPAGSIYQADKERQIDWASLPDEVMPG